MSAFAAPRLPGTLIDRPKLERRVGPESGASWTLVVGPAGSGKTTLVRSALAGRTDPWSWINVANAPSRRSGVSDLIVRAVQRTRLDRPLDALDALDMEGGEPQLILAHLLDELASDSEESSTTVVVLDDAHLLAADDWALLGWFLGRPMPVVHLVIVSRVDPPIALGRERATGRMSEVRARDLAFGFDQTERLVEATAGATPVAVTRALQVRTEGWVAGVRLASLALRNGADPDELIRGLTSNNTSIAEFLLEEVLDHQPAGKRDFLRAVAILAVLEPDICEAVTGRTDSAATLRRVAADGLFVTPIGDGERYRFHPLLAELLRFEQIRADPDVARLQHLRAADWLIANDRGIEAIEHLLQAGEHSRAHEFVRDSFAALYVGAHRRDIDRWLDAMPDDVIGESLERAVDHCVALSLVGSQDVQRWWIFCAEHVGPTDEWARSRLDCVIAMNDAVNGRLPELRTHWRTSRERRPHDRADPLDEIVALWEVRLETCLADPAVGVQLARTLLASPRRLLPDVSAMSVLAGALDAARQYDDALAVADHAVALWRTAGEPELPGMLDAFVVKARAARRAGNLDVADDLIDIALHLPPQRQAPHLLLAIALIERARIDHARGGERWQSDLVVLAEELRMANAPSTVIDWVDAARADLLSEAAPSAPRRLGGPRTRSAAPVADLTDRELVILRLLASHLTLPEIGEELHISRHTVKSHTRRIYAKLDSSSRSEAVRRAREIDALPDPTRVQPAVVSD